ncbi:MAG TPA: VWA domain-containing protein [Thermoanaerobaculia bacterium]|nr:VWA domain-containing protein [Thermoanaerobaculia bacterium]
MRYLPLLLLLVALPLAAEPLPEKYRVWLEDVELLLSPEERATFLALGQDYQRDAFIRRFWEVRDEQPRTARNELREGWESRIQEARRRFVDLTDGRARVLLFNGIPDEVIVSGCPTVLWPLEAWIYSRSERTKAQLVVILYQKWGAGKYRIWNPLDGMGALLADGAATVGEPGAAGGNPGILSCRNHEHGTRIAGAIGWVGSQGMGWQMLEAKLDSPPPPPSGEWVPTFTSYSTDVPEGAPALNARLDVDFPGRRQSRTVLQALLTVSAAEAGQAQLAGSRSYNFLLTGEVVRRSGEDTELFDSFRYRFDLPASQGEAIPLVFQRPLRPGEYTLILKLEDMASGRFFRAERPLSVPKVENDLPPPPPSDPETARRLAEATAALVNGETVVKLLQPFGELQTGMNRFDTLTSGDVSQVTFALDGKPVLTKRKPPFSVELDLGSLPKPRTLEATAFDASGREVARDEMLVNAASNRFRVRLVEPRQGQRYESSLLARMEVEAPDGESIERVEVFLDETRVATLFQPPWEQPIILSPSRPQDRSLAYVRTVAYLTDGSSTEDLVFVNAPDYLEQIDVDFVELYTTALDRQGRPVEGLAAKDFTVSEDGKRQQIARFERVTDLPIHAAVVLDVSASMEDSLERATGAALGFLQSAMRPKDRAALVTFNDRPHLAVKFTKDVDVLAGGLAGLKAERGTALYDTIVFSLFYFNGVKGQRAVVLLSDGKDEGSRFSYEDALDYARRAGVAIYPIGLGEELEKRKLEKLAEETGGRAFFLKDAAELAGIYAAIQEELRSKYLIAYQSTNTTGSDGFRAVDLKVSRPGVEAKTLRGYYP